MKHKDDCSTKTIINGLLTDKQRVQHLQSKYINNQLTKSTQTPLNSGAKLQILNYIVTIQLGKSQFTVIVDTGSDLTWVQCLSNTSTSSTYKRVQCKSPICRSLLSATGNSGVCSGQNNKTCNYFMSYGDGSYSIGEMGKETLTLGNISIKEFAFGCGRDNKGVFGGTSGLIGLGRSDLSLVSQTTTFGGVFSYCLPEISQSGSLVLGKYSFYKNITPFTDTKMLRNPNLPTFYFLNVTGMSVGGVRFGNRGGYQFLIDSGTVISRLPIEMYRAVEEEFLKQFSGFPSAPSYSILERCFDLSGYEEVNVPVMKFEFEGGGGMEIDVSGVFYFAKSDASQVCLALASLSSEEEIGIIGNHQQRNQRVVYDTKNSKLGFAAESCTFV